ncbi:hypothetical protein K2173_006922 [Erythroxylum novogranatense]|uniref:Protein NEOXANTHIN-DEFICIENT 1 n=1 Tax=Erythroxylum novogranatense TaxID=1862640 RepID=A0AAV8SY38_9ROSI|nr:hypothetical protein K2173_006922 [Erythroxylum novogranatense]
MVLASINCFFTCRNLLVIMEVGEPKRASGYGEPPWRFRGRALYQLHLVKAETARSFIPKEFRLVEAFGYTLGGFFLASYEDSPAGPFDELVVIAGIMWNPPTSCAWAARVLVSSDDACNHGRKHVGLPSQVAKFSKRVTAIPRQEGSTFNGFLNMIGLGGTLSSADDCADVRVTELNGPSVTDICDINLKSVGLKSNKWMGPSVKMSLPSFSGGTKYIPNFLRYSCHIECRVRTVRPVKVSGLPLESKDGVQETFSHQNCLPAESTRDELDNGLIRSISVMLSKPLLAFEFTSLKMRVEAPVVLTHVCKNTLGTSSQLS